jgi:hypothetical protein
MGVKLVDVDETATRLLMVSDGSGCGCEVFWWFRTRAAQMLEVGSTNNQQEKGASKEWQLLLIPVQHDNALAVVSTSAQGRQTRMRNDDDEEGEVVMRRGEA